MDKFSKPELKILKAAKLIFLRDGLAGAKTQEIADKAKVNKALLHYYFRNKEGLFEKVLGQACHQFSKPFSLLQNAELNFMERLDLFTLEMIALAKQDPSVIAFVVQAMNQHQDLLPENFKQEIAPISFLETMREGAKQGFLRVKDVDTAWLCILSLLCGAASIPTLSKATLENSAEGLENYYHALPLQIKSILIG